jgi:hypothetical protein
MLQLNNNISYRIIFIATVLLIVGITVKRLG